MEIMKNFKIFLLNFLLSIGILAIISPAFLYCFIHGDYDRYIWIINGPFPFSSFGGGPFQLLMYMGLFITGVVLISVSLIIKFIIKKEK
jgi:hypothetical protein